MHILLVTFFFPPEIGAAATRAFELARIMNRMGIKISVLTGIPNYPLGRYYNGYNKCSLMMETMEGIDVYRTYVKPSDNYSKVSRLLSYFSFWLSARFNSKHIDSFDVIVATVGPLMTAAIGYRLGRQYKVPFILETRDIAYKQVIATGFSSPYIANLIKMYELFFARRADRVVCVTDGYKRDFVKNAIPVDKIHVIKNGFDFDNTLQPNYTQKVIDMLRDIRNKKRQYKRTLGFFGVLGVSQDLLTLVKGMKNLQNTLLILIGRGAQFIPIQNVFNSESIPNVVLYEAVSEAEIIPFYNEVDFNLSVLRDSPEFVYTIPSKIFRVMGYGAVPVFVGPDGEAAAIVKSIDPRLYVTDLKELERIEIQEISSLKKKAMLICRQNFDRRIQAKAYVEILQHVLDRR